MITQRQPGAIALHASETCGGDAILPVASPLTICMILLQAWPAWSALPISLVLCDMLAGSRLSRHMLRQFSKNCVVCFFKYLFRLDCLALALAGVVGSIEDAFLQPVRAVQDTAPFQKYWFIDAALALHRAA